MNVRMINTIGRWLASCLLLFMVSSCIDDGFESASQGVIDENGMVHLSIQTNVPGLKVTRAVDINGEAITTLWVLAFNEYGNMISRVLATQTNNVQGTAGGTGTFTASVPSSTRILHFLANVNMDNFSDQSNIGRHENEVIAPLVSSSGNLVYWGRREFNSQEELTDFATNSVNNPVLLYRNQALILYDVSTPATGITLEVEGWAICNQYAYGTVAPFDASALEENNASPFRFDLGTFDYVTEVPETYRVKQRDDDEVATASGVDGDPRYIFENANVEDDQVFVIMRIRKTENGDSSEKYYKILVVDDKKVPYPIIRNHKYTVKITNVNESYGVDTYEDALTATPANNPWITISDEIPEVINGSTTLRIEGETTVVYQQAGQYTIDFYYNGTSKPVVEWLSNDGIAAPVSDGDVTWNASTKKGTIMLNVNSPVEGQVSYATLQIKESDGFLSRRVKVISSEPFSFSPTWVSSEIPLLDNEDITLLFRIPDDFPDELLPVEVKFGCDLIDGQVGQPLKVVNEETVYSSMPVYNAGTQQWETQVISTDWNYKYVYTATQKGIQRVNFRTILTNLSNIAEAQEFHIYMEGCTAKSGQELFEQRDLYFAFQDNSASSYRNRYRIMLEGGDANRKFTSRTIEDLEPIYGESIEIPFTLGTLRTDENATSSWNNDVVSATGVNAQVWVYYDPALVTPQWNGTTGIDAYGNYYMVYNTTTAENSLPFNTLSPNFDCYIVLAAKSKSGYGQGTPSPPEMGVNDRGYRSASVTIRSSGRFDFKPEISTDGSVFTPVNGGGSFSIPYGTGQDVWLRIQVPVAAQDKAFQFKLGTKYLEPVDQTQWTKWTTAEGDGWTYTFTANETTGTKDFHFKTTRLSSEETLSLSSGNYVGFNSLTVDMLNKQLTGTIQLPGETQFSTGSPYIILERASDGTRIGTFDLGEASLVGLSKAVYSLTLRGEYNLTETDRINVKWSPVTSNEIYIYSGLLRDLLTDGRTIELQLQQ